METFVAHNSIVRKIWGKPDIVLFIFAGAAAEFALNKSVDWLYFTGRLPKDPIGRMFSTVEYAHKIIFMDKENALASIAHITTIHKAVEEKRGALIPDWAYRDVLFLLIYYSISACELLDRKLIISEKEEIFDVFRRVGQAMQIPELPDNYKDWLLCRKHHLQRNIENSLFSSDLFLQYKKQLGPMRYWTMLQVQARIAPEKVQQLLFLQRSTAFHSILQIYRLFRGRLMYKNILPLLLPKPYAQQIKKLYRS